MKGIIFDIQRFALHDGPGIRTVIFLKGCPLKCKWCSNPESMKLQPQLAFAADKCIDTKNCFDVCSEGVFSDVLKKQKVDYSKCTICGKCIEDCPSGALKIYGFETGSDEIIEEVIKDKEYYKNSGGGLTLSGGEPLFQFDFAYEILKKAKKEGIHTAIETTGYTSSEKIKKIMPVTDLFLYDYKLTDNSEHCFYTGVSNKTIIENLKLILLAGGKVILRCIIIPGINDTNEHFKAIANLSQHKNVKKVDIMPYHEYGKHKYRHLSMTSHEIGIKTLTEHPNFWMKKIEKFGCSKINA